MTDEQFPLSWGSISGKEVHDAGGREGIGNLFITLESALMPALLLTQKGVRPMDFIVMAVPTDKRDVIEQFMEQRFGGAISQERRN